MEKQKKDSLGKARRRLLKVLTAGGAAATMPSQWAKPIVESVVTPAHAQTSDRLDQRCTIDAFAFFVGTHQISLSIGVQAQASLDCGTSARVELLNSNDQLIIDCPQSPGTVGAGDVSWSCNTLEIAPPNYPQQGDSVTFTITWENGCSCSVVSTVQ